MLDRSKFIGRGADSQEGAPKPAYRHQAFPAMLHHHETGAMQIVEDQDAADSAGQGWYPSPKQPAKKTFKK